MNSTKKYIQENQYVLSLPRVYVEFGINRKRYFVSIFDRLIINCRSTLTCIKNYPKEIWIGRKFLQKSYRIKNTKFDRKALVIGNGPSQGFLDAEQLNNFTLSGGETICVNFWHLNISLSTHVPTWLVLSDPKSFNLSVQKSKSKGLIEYLHLNPKIKLVMPCSLLDEFRKFDLKNEVHIFIDTELPIWKNINPIFPRGYVSMTLYKALAWAIHLNFAETGIIGMDNTYPRNIYCDKNNRVLNLEVHGGLNDYVLDQTDDNSNIATVLDHLLLIFYHLEFFPTEKIVNLDPYSLTDRFKKIDFHDFFTINR